ncbi:helix-turn-helix domain-containing protein [Streptomyces sp. NPDC058773]|uniref:transcriptional regulator n=1 Tax=Streptomyces sp. NPDC058773 TaxID=3346632 RepID=UPI003684886E
MGTETEEFAGLLRRLKERSGRSYGALAAQVHMSVSTLHRYCNGDAVPMDFAPADRLARRCGATPDELVELHRRWIIADEARRRSRATSAVTTTPSAAPAAASSDEPATPSSEKGERQNPDHPNAPEPLDTAQPLSTSPSPNGTAAPDRPGSTATTSATSGTAATNARAATDRPPAPPAPPAPESLVEALTAAEPTEAPAEPVVASSGRGFARLGYLRVALLAGAVASLGVLAAWAVQDPTLGDPQRRSAHGAERPPAASSAPTPLTESPSPGHTTADPKPTPGGKERHSPSSTVRPDGSGTSRAPDGGKGGTAPQVGVSSYNWDAPCAVNYLLQRTPDRVPPPPAPQDARPWAGALGAVDGGHMQLQLTATGDTEASVVLTSLHARVVAKHAALPWRVYGMGDGCGGGVTPQTFNIDLDDAQPVAKPVAGQDGDIKVPAKNFPFKVSTKDPQVLNLDVHTEGHDVSWYLEVGWSSGDRQGTIRVDDGGKPFRTSATEGRKRYLFQWDKKRWGSP